MYDPELTFHGPDCHLHRDRRSRISSNDIVYDETILDDPDAILIGALEAPEMTNEEYQKKLREATKKVPKKFHKYLHLFYEEKAATLPPHRQSDCAIDLMPGKMPPYRPMYRLSQYELELL